MPQTVTVSPQEFVAPPVFATAPTSVAAQTPVMSQTSVMPQTPVMSQTSVMPQAPVISQTPVMPQPSRSGSVQGSGTPQPSGVVNFTQETDDQGRNYNDRVLELYKSGKSNVAIARELNLGVGEVKLVIDLYKNRSEK